MDSTAADVRSGVVTAHLTNSQRAVPLNTEFMVVCRIHVPSTHHLWIYLPWLGPAHRSARFKVCNTARQNNITPNSCSHHLVICRTNNRVFNIKVQVWFKKGKPIWIPSKFSFSCDKTCCYVKVAKGQRRRRGSDCVLSSYRLASCLWNSGLWPYFLAGKNQEKNFFFGIDDFLTLDKHYSANAVSLTVYLVAVALWRS